MEIRELAYQQRVLKLLDDYLTALVEHKVKADKLEKTLVKDRADDPNATCFLKVPRLDFPLQTWEALKKANKLPLSRVNIDHSPRSDGIGRAVPNIVYKIPTAGGKTFLAVSSLAKIFNKYLNRSTGFVLWIVPNEAIYTQTKKQLLDRSHPYRQLLDNLSGNAVKIMEKKTPLNAHDVESNLCLMLLMLQSSNRENKDSLKIFQDRGDVRGFSPEEDNQLAHQEALKATPNLNICDLSDSSYCWMPVRDSLGNALRLIRPVVVMDEGHKAVSDLAFKTLYGFNPSFVLELTATPKDVKARSGKKPQDVRYQNILVEVSGLELDQESMIKMPLNLDSRQSSDWKSTLKAALDRLNELGAQARQLHANQHRYIRPIMLVQVERTGNDQRDGRYTHAEDVKEWLMQTGKLDEAEVAIKSSSKNDLKQPENQDLLSQSNRIRAIITKQALQEGWDCPFAYVLCSLAPSSNPAAMTQLLGRILRQPQARKTNIGVLDESYVLTHNTETNKVVKAIKEGLEKDGMGDLGATISVSGVATDRPLKREIQRNDKFKNTQIFLPKVLWVTDDEKRELDYEEDILYALDWQALELEEFVNKIPKNYLAAERQLQRIWLEKSADTPVKTQYIGSPREQRYFNCAYATQLISDIIPNPWLTRELVAEVVAGLKRRGFKPGKLGKFSNLINAELRKWLFAKRDQKAETRFRTEVLAGRIQFHLQTDCDIKKMHWEMPFKSVTNQTNGASQLLGSRSTPLQRSLFLPMYEEDMNTCERNVAVYMDDTKTIKWWHRNVSRNHYGLQGWRRDKIYPDFICELKIGDSGTRKLVVLEMKGEHLEGNADTEYKKAMLELMTKSFPVEQEQRVGEVNCIGQDGTSMHCELVLFSDWEAKLAKILRHY